MSSEDGEDESFYDAEDDTIESEKQKAHARRVAGIEEEALMGPSEIIGQRSAAGRESATSDDAPRARSRSRSSVTSARADSRSSSTRSHHRYSLPPSTLEPVPLIPAKYLETGSASLVQRTSDDTRAPPSPLHIRRPALATSSSLPRSSTQRVTHKGNDEVARGQSLDASPERPTSRFARRKSMPACTPQIHETTLEKLESNQTQGNMSRLGQRRNEDLFLELANDGQDSARPPSRGGERALSRLSQTGKRRSMPSSEHTLPSPGDRRPKSSGQAVSNRPASRLDAMQSHVQHPQHRYRNTPSRAAYRADDTASLSGRSQSGRPQRWSSMAERSPASPSLRERLASPESMQYGRRRPSFGGAPLQPPKTRGSRLPGSFDEHSESPEESSEAKQSQDSTDADSQSADTVWDELDDLKSRIKKLELTGKLPQTSRAAMSSNEAGERPRTATTAPTTINSSPKRDKQEKKAGPAATPAEVASADYSVGGPSVTNIHPLLHSALAKAKPLLNPNLYRTLEATASDALQLAAMTGGAGPQGTAFSAASIINGATVSDRHVRRKADTMCRNLTDLCLALCDGKLDSNSTAASPVTSSTPLRNSPSVRHARSSLGPNEGVRATSRPMSRLEVRRTSILGTGSSFGASPSPNRESEDVSASDAEHTPSHAPPQDYRHPTRSGSRLQVQRQHYDDYSGDEDPTIRPISRAMTDNFRSKPSGPRDYNSPGAQRSPSLRDSLVARRANAAAHEDNQKLTRVMSMNSESGRRRFLDHSTPPVLEEEGTGAEAYESSSASKRRVTSYGFGNRRANAEGPSRATSLNQRRHVVVE